jgi:hypothetical protein
VLVVEPFMALVLKYYVLRALINVLFAKKMSLNSYRQELLENSQMMM